MPVTSTVYRSPIILKLGERQFATESMDTSFSDIRTFALADGKKWDVEMGWRRMGPKRWIEIDANGTELREVTQTTLLQHPCQSCS